MQTASAGPVLGSMIAAIGPSCSARTSSPRKPRPASVGADRRARRRVDCCSAGSGARAQPSAAHRDTARRAGARRRNSTDVRRGPRCAAAPTPDIRSCAAGLRRDWLRGSGNGARAGTSAPPGLAGPGRRLHRSDAPPGSVTPMAIGSAASCDVGQALTANGPTVTVVAVPSGMKSHGSPPGETACQVPIDASTGTPWRAARRVAPAGMIAMFVRQRDARRARPARCSRVRGAARSRAPKSRRRSAAPRRRIRARKQLPFDPDRARSIASGPSRRRCGVHARRTAAAVQRAE